MSVVEALVADVGKGARPVGTVAVLKTPTDFKALAVVGVDPVGHAVTEGLRSFWLLRGLSWLLGRRLAVRRWTAAG